MTIVMPANFFGLLLTQPATETASSATDLLAGFETTIRDLLAYPPLVLLSLGLGLALWLVGDRLFRPLASLAGAGLGAFLGLAGASLFMPESIATIPVAYWTIGLGALVGLILGALLYRLVIGASTAFTAAALAGALVAAVLVGLPQLPATSPHDTPHAAPPRPETMAQAISQHQSRAPYHTLSTRSTPPSLNIEQLAQDLNIRTIALHTNPDTDPASHAVQGLSAATLDIHSFIPEQWASLPAKAQQPITAAAILGACLGLALGLLRPRAAGPAVAALAGSSLWLGATTLILLKTGTDLPARPAEQPAWWLIAWLAVATVGFVIQRKRKSPAHQHA